MIPCGEAVVECVTQLKTLDAISVNHRCVCLVRSVAPAFDKTKKNVHDDRVCLHLLFVACLLW